jgi:imidazolonepropionase-like amidohydrolase
MKLTPTVLTCVRLLAVTLLLGASPEPPTRYSVVMSGIAKGKLDVTREDDSRRVLLSFRDRGRGPDLVTVTRYNPAGVPVAVDISGTDYRRIAIAEHFEMAAGKAQWTSAVDTGSAAADGFYVANEGNDEQLAALARALLKAPGQRLPLLPTGEASIRKMIDHKVTGNAGEAIATLYFIDGLGMEPTPIWLDRDGELFAGGGTWFGVIRTGYEAGQPALIAAQTRASDEAARADAARLAKRPAGPVLIRGALLFDAEARVMRPGMSVLVRGDRIVAVGRDSSIAMPKGALVIDARGRSLLPGLWDMHVHLLGQRDGLMAMMAGITTVRDLGNDVPTLKALADQFDSGALIGPHVLKAGLIDGRGQFAGPTKALVSTPEEAKAAVDQFAALGYSMVKLYSSLAPALVRIAAAEAHAKGLRVGGHVPAGMTMIEAVDAGYDEVQHANFWLLQFLGPEVAARSNTPARFTDAYTRGHEIDPTGVPARAFVEHLKAKGTVVDPTLVTFENMFTGWKGEMSGWIAPWAARMPATALRDSRGGGRATTSAQLADYRASFLRMQQLLKAMHDAGVPVVNGTDGSAMLYARELELHVAAGIPAADVLYDATLGAARVMKLDRDTGSIAAGKRADLILVDGDPTLRIGAVRCTSLVMKDGVLHDGNGLAVAAGLKPRKGACQ